MSRIGERFRQLETSGRKGLITFITAGDPNLATTEKIVPLLERAGADFIELGIPFSDPMADGPAIQLSSERALASGTSLAGILASVRTIRKVSSVPIILMGYFNPILAYGIDRFAADAATAGVDGLLLVDLPPEESGELHVAMVAHGIDPIYLLTPTSDESRVKAVYSRACGFIYYVSVTGVTGARSSVASGVGDAVCRIRSGSPVPVAVGFGISTPEQAAQVASFADAVVVGSALVRFFENATEARLEAELATFVSALRDAITPPSN